MKAEVSPGFGDSAPMAPRAKSLILIAPPDRTELLQPEIVTGRWLVPDDENALMVSLKLLDDKPDLYRGDRIALDINDRTAGWVIAV